MGKKYLIDETTLTDIASAIRTKTNSTGDIPVTNFASGILNIQSTDTSDATATAEDIVLGKTAYINGQKITGTHVDIPEEQIKSYYTGSTTPDNSLGNDGDLFLVRG